MVSSTLIRQEPKSTPTVTLCSVSNWSFVSRVSTHDFPMPTMNGYVKNKLKPTGIAENYNFQEPFVHHLFIESLRKSFTSEVFNLSCLLRVMLIHVLRKLGIGSWGFCFPTHIGRVRRFFADLFTYRRSRLLIKLRLRAKFWSFHYKKFLILIISC